MPRYFATSAKGIETVTAEELKKLGATGIELGFGGVYFEGDQSVLYRANLWSRTASRILMPLREFAAKTPQMLYDQVRRVHWEDYLNPDVTFAIDSTIAGMKSLGKSAREAREAARLPTDDRYNRARAGRPREGINHSHFAGLKIKDAIVDRLRTKFGARPNVDTMRPDVRIVAYFSNDRCVLSLDSTGRPLHERGYRLEGARAPLKENLAAAIVELSGWDPKTPFVDPMCGSGTLALEAALKALDVAPGLFRPDFGFFRWPDYNESLWTQELEKAQERALKRTESPIVGYDRDREAIATAISNAKNAGLLKAVHFEKRNIEQLQPVGEKAGTLIVNPPYGERLGEANELKELYKLLGDLFKQRMKGWTCHIFTGNLELAKSVGLQASKRTVLYNGPIECRLLRYEIY